MIDAFARHGHVVERVRPGDDAAAEPGVHSDEAARRVRGGDRFAQGRHRQAHAGEDVEADGQGCQAVPALPDEPEELAAVHTGHTAGHVPAAQVHLHAVRERAGRPVRQRALQRFHTERHTQVQAGHQAVQGGQGEDVRRELALQAQPDQAQSGVQPHAERAEGGVPPSPVRRRQVQDNQERRRRLLAAEFRNEVSA